MLRLSEQIIHKLTDITKTESKLLPLWIEKNYVAKCIIPPLSENSGVHCNIAVVAPVSGGKSTLINALCGYPILPTASKVTSCAPTYISRTKEQSQECVTVYGIKKKTTEKDGLSSTRFEKDTNTRKIYYAKDVSKEMFKDLFDYMYLVIHGSGLEYATTIENVAYFMKSTEKADILFKGDDSQKQTIMKEDFALSYENPRHRLMLLLILLCIYVNQNDSEREMSEYTKEVNQQRTTLLEKYEFPAQGDYCVYLDWCSDDIHENATLIDLPGTGAATEDTDKQSSHTALVRGILTEADAIWVLCSENGVVDPDLIYALKDVIENNMRKNKVCIYNCKNNRPNDSGPVIDFLKKLPALTGERCYVVDARAGEYKYIQNDVNALMTGTAADIRFTSYFREPSEGEITQTLEFKYSGEKSSYCTFTTNKDSSGNIVAVQDGSLKYTLYSFIKNALTDYIERLKYEVSLTKTIEQAKFYIYIRDSLASSRSILESINGKGAVISKAVNEALEFACDQALDSYVAQTTKFQTVLSDNLQSLSNRVEGNIKKEFRSSLNFLIESIKYEWRSLEREGSPNRLKANFFGNYPLKTSNSNWSKFVNVRTAVENKITVSTFDKALLTADNEIKKYNDLLNGYVNDLKTVTHNFVNDYINAFLQSYDQKRDELCGKERDNVTDKVYQNFNSTREKLKGALETKLNALCVSVCDSFDILTAPKGIFDSLCEETAQIFRNGFCENIIDELRAFMYNKFTSIHNVGFFLDRLRPEDLHNILNDDFSNKKDALDKKLSGLVEQIYGGNTGGDENFPSILSLRLLRFNADKIANGAMPEIYSTHASISALVGFGADIAVDLTEQLKEIDAAIKTWAEIGADYLDLYNNLEDSKAENTKRLYDDCQNQINKISLMMAAKESSN